MKHLLHIIIFTLLAFSAAGQSCPVGPLPAVGGSKDKWHVKFYLTSDSIMVVPQDTIKTTCWPMNGAIAYKAGQFWGYKSNAWSTLIPGGGGVTQQALDDTAASIRSAIPSGGSGTVTSVNTGYGVLGGPITTTGTLLFDSATVLTGLRAYLTSNYYTKTEVNTIANLRLLISDTTNMLAPYLPRWLAATTYLSQASAALNYVPVTDLSTSADAGKVVQRTSDANAYANNFVSNTATITASGTTRVLTASSARTQQVTGTGNQVYQLPVATTLAAGFPFEFDNNATGTVTVNNSAGTTLFTIPSGGYTVVKLMVVGGGGTWDFHSTVPANSTWGTAGVDVTGAVTATGAVTGSNLSGTNTGDQTNITGNAATVTTNANLTGPVTSVGNATAITATGVSAGSYTYTALTVNAAGQITAASSGSAPTGTVTAVSIATANGFAGSSSGGATPALTMSVTPTSGSILKSTTGGAITAAVAGTDYLTANQTTTVTTTGDATGTASGTTNISVPLVFATVNSNTGNWGNATTTPTITVNAKGLVTAVGTVTPTPAIANVTGLGTGVATLLAATPSGTTSLAGTASPTFTGTPIAPTPAAGTNTGAIATASFVTTALVAYTTQTVTTTSYTTSVTVTSATASPDSRVVYTITAQAGALLFNNPSGSWADEQVLIIRIKDNGTARALTYGTKFRGTSPLLPATTVINQTLYEEYIYNATDDKYDLAGFFFAY